MNHWRIHDPDRFFRIPLALDRGPMLRLGRNLALFLLFLCMLSGSNADKHMACSSLLLEVQVPDSVEPPTFMKRSEGHINKYTAVYTYIIIGSKGKKSQKAIRVNTSNKSALRKIKNNRNNKKKPAHSGMYV